MNKELIIKQTIEVINKLPENKAEEISDFANFVIKRYEENRLTEELHNVISHSNTFDFLQKEEDLYTEADIKEKYNG